MDESIAYVIGISGVGSGGDRIYDIQYAEQYLFRFLNDTGVFLGG